MSNNFDRRDLTREYMLQRAAAELREQLQKVLFLNDRHIRSIRFEVAKVSVEPSELPGIRGLIEYDGDLENVLQKLRSSYVVQLKKASGLQPNSRWVEATISPLVKPAGWDEQADMPSTFELEIRQVEPTATIPFPSHAVAGEDENRLEEVVFLIHGIRDRAQWQTRVQRILQEIPGVKVIPIKFGFLDGIRFWFPFWTRKWSIEFTRQQIQIGKNRNPAKHYSVIAHSFGTYAITKILTDTKDLVLNRLVLCGCVVRQDFPWDNLASRITGQIVNDYGTRDIWPVMAKTLSWGYGETGRHGFGRADVFDRGHDFKHSDFFQESFIREYWRSWFATGTIKPSNWEEQAPPSPWLLDVYSILPVKTFLLLLFLTISFASYWFQDEIWAFASSCWNGLLGAVGR